MPGLSGGHVHLAVVAVVLTRMTVHAVHPRDGVVHCARVLTVNGPVDGEHAVVVRGHLLLRSYRLHHPVELAAVVEDTARRELLSCLQNSLPRRKQIGHVQSVGVKYGRAGGRIGPHSGGVLRS